ncbi:GntR family transcriptional regulator [Pseudomonas sp.]|uniref:GntR family transcriptional regulator n=1 Tax=Pseudomonas sp. TaxID=306 RepID=UPI00260AF0AA|nr:GntR family transcriptional regulator [Pseudomonas sp.]
MIKQARFNKKQRVVNELVYRIKSGLLVYGHPLPEQAQLAHELRVSSITLREALAELERRRYIAMKTEGGAIVTYDGITLDQHNGWTQALADTGARIHTELLQLQAVERPELAHTFGFTHFITLERRRRRDDGTAISLERSLMPATAGLESLPRVGLIDASLTITLAAYGFVGNRGDQWIGAEPLSEEDALLLGRKPGTVFIKTLRTTYDRQDRFMEQVESWLDPHHFRMYRAFGPQQ